VWQAEIFAGNVISNRSKTMDNRSYLAILASGVLFAGGIAGCDAGDPNDPGTPEPESSAMYDAEETDQAADSMADRQMQAEDRAQQSQQMAQQPTEQQATTPQDSAADSLETLGANEIVGKTVVNQQGEEIGEIDEVVMDTNTQQQLAVIDVGGFLGIGEKSVAVSFDELQLSDDGRVGSNLTRETLQSQPEYDPAQFGEAADPME
jgi:sporulation protein YlmC with PRC-barrel domain